MRVLKKAGFNEPEAVAVIGRLVMDILKSWTLTTGREKRRWR